MHQSVPKPTQCTMCQVKADKLRNQPRKIYFFRMLPISRLAPVLKTIFHQCFISYTCSQSNSDGSVLKLATLATRIWYDTLMKICFKDWSKSTNKLRSLCTAKPLSRLGRCPVCSQSLLCSYTILLVLPRIDSNPRYSQPGDCDNAFPGNPFPCELRPSCECTATSRAKQPAWGFFNWFFFSRKPDSRVTDVCELRTYRVCRANVLQ